jgi:hypothetical protein
MPPAERVCRVSLDGNDVVPSVNRYFQPTNGFAQIASPVVAAGSVFRHNLIAPSDRIFWLSFTFARRRVNF